MERIEEVEIIVDGQNYAAARDCELSKTEKGTRANAIKWFNLTRNEYVIDFGDHSPFVEKGTIKVPAREGKVAGEIGPYHVSPTVKAKSYAYSITPLATIRVMAADPIVIVHDT
jgi:hypothetical protein